MDAGRANSEEEQDFEMNMLYIYILSEQFVQNNF